MRIKPFVCAALITAMMPAVALADDPNDSTMRSAAARARDREMTRQLNLEEQARVRKREAGWRAARASDTSGSEYADRSRDHDRAVAGYSRDRAQYEREMAQWRRAVAACRAGDHSACAK